MTRQTPYEPLPASDLSALGLAASLVIEVFENVGMKCGSEVGRISVIKNKEISLNRMILGAKILLEL